MKYGVLLAFLVGCIPTQKGPDVELPNRTELVKVTPTPTYPEPDTCTRDHMGEFLRQFDDDMATKSGCNWLLDETVYCLQLFPCTEQRSRCERTMQRLDVCINKGLEEYSRKLAPRSL